VDRHSPVRLSVVLALALAACTTNPVTLRHVDGRTVQCGPYPTRGYDGNTAAAIREAKCIDDFTAQGFRRE